MNRPPSRIKAILLALLVTFIWSTSWIFIKIGLREIPAITFAGLRYTLAFICLLPFVLRKSELAQLGQLRRSEWIQLVILGIVYYALAQGAQFFGLVYLSSITVSLILNLTSLFVAVFGMLLIKEQPTLLQWFGIALNLVGVGVYFQPGAFGEGPLIGYVAAAISLLANVFGAILGRKMNLNGKLRPIPLTGVSMGIGAFLMLLTGLITEGLPAISLQSWGILLLLAVVNTAFSFTVWNYTLQTLTAMESSIINSTMMIQVAILAWIFLGERVSPQAIMGLLLVLAGTMIVQIRFPGKISSRAVN
jgi:drug/metabolite transporter (DMT)-like permease